LLFGGVAAAESVRLTPVDDGAVDASWSRFRARLIEALLRRDQKFVGDIVERNVRNISGIDGITEFRKLWELNSAESPLWSELPKLLFLGSATVKQGKGSEVCAPYVYYKWPNDAPNDANAAVTTREALLKARPSIDAPSLQTLSYDLVNVTDWEVADEMKDGKQIWVGLRMGTTTGYLPQEQVRSPIEYRACFVKRDGSWRLSGLEVGE
jgi:hypothetical protein